MSYKKENKGSEIFCNAIENSVNVFKDVLVQNKIENPEKYEEKRNSKIEKNVNRLNL
tara:strand:- start:161 stop:331 length:171 start_codon:yes stop_codon:yes gene_type:complete